MYTQKANTQRADASDDLRTSFVPHIDRRLRNGSLIGSVRPLDLSNESVTVEGCIIKPRSFVDSTRSLRCLELDITTSDRFA